MTCTSVTVSSVVPEDKYYDCVNEECIEKIGGQYKNDPKCAGKCKPKDNTEMIIALGLAAVAAMALFGSKR